MSPPPKTVIVLDDNPDELLITRMYVRLDPQGFDFLFFQTFPEVVAELDKRLTHGRPMPDIIVTDLNMPRWDGIEVLTQLRERLDKDETLIGVYTGMMNDRVRRSVANANADFLIEKPLSPAKIRKAVAKGDDRSAQALAG